VNWLSDWMQPVAQTSWTLSLTYTILSVISDVTGCIAAFSNPLAYCHYHGAALQSSKGRFYATKDQKEAFVRLIHAYRARLPLHAPAYRPFDSNPSALSCSEVVPTVRSAIPLHLVRGLLHSYRPCIAWSTRTTRSPHQRGLSYTAPSTEAFPEPELC
jgi:hypothetical protein